MKRIDFENHFYIPEFIQALGVRKDFPLYDAATDFIHWSAYIKMPQGKLLEQLEAAFEKRVARLDACRIDCAVLSSSPGIEELDNETARALCTKTNDVIYAHTQRFPGRFYGSAILPVNDVQAACRELERCVKEYGFVAWHTHSNYGKTAPDDPQYLSIFEKAQELGVYVYLHPQMPDLPRMRDLNFPFAGPALGFTVDTQTTILRMICTGLFDKVPGITVMLGHFGEALPFLLDRIDNRLKFLPAPNIVMKKSVKEYFANNIMVSTSGNTSEAAFECTKKVLGIDRMVIGSDMPYEDPKDMIDFLDTVSLTTEEREKLYFRNAEKLFA